MKRDREMQLKIFEIAQWFKALTRSLVLVNLRDSTFEAHFDEAPLNAFANAINFYIKPPRFAQVIRKRLELLIEALPGQLAPIQEYSLPNGIVIKYPASRLGEYLISLYLSIFHRGTQQIGAALEALIAKDVRRALGMFSDIIISPHVPTEEITGVRFTDGKSRIKEYRIIRALMRGRYKYFTGSSVYVRNILRADASHERPSNFLNADILEFLIRNRKMRIDLRQEGYACIKTVIARMGVLGYTENDARSAVLQLVKWGLVEPESLVFAGLTEDDSITGLTDEDAIRVHASGFIHMRFFLERDEYLIGITPNMNYSSREVAEEIGAIWSGQMEFPDLTFNSKRKILNWSANYFGDEYRRRCGRYAFYDEGGWGGRVISEAARASADKLNRI